MKKGGSIIKEDRTVGIYEITITARGFVTPRGKQKKRTLLQVFRSREEKSAGVLSCFKDKELATGCIYYLWLIEGVIGLREAEARLGNLWGRTRWSATTQIGKK